MENEISADGKNIPQVKKQVKQKAQNDKRIAPLDLASLERPACFSCLNVHVVSCGMFCRTKTCAVLVRMV